MSAEVSVKIKTANHAREIHTSVALATGGLLDGFALSHQMRVVVGMAVGAVWDHVHDACDEEELWL